MTAVEQTPAAKSVSRNPSRNVASAPARIHPELPREAFSELSDRAAARGGRILQVRAKYVITLGIAAAWATLSYFLAFKWITDLSSVFGAPLAYVMVFTIAIIPGFMNAFIVSGLLFDRRPRRTSISTYPGLTILVAAYNEEDSILGTLESIDKQNYPGPLEVFVINDGSKDKTAERVRSVSYPWLHFIDLKRNGGKAKALNAGLEHVSFDLTLTLDGDSLLYRDALTRIVGRFLSDPPNTASVAGTVLVRNSRKNMVTKIQEWD